MGGRETKEGWVWPFLRGRKKALNKSPSLRRVGPILGLPRHRN
jgi:hypothetical protein